MVNLMLGGGTTLQWVRIRGSRIIPITSCYGHLDINFMLWPDGLLCLDPDFFILSVV